MSLLVLLLISFALAAENVANAGVPPPPPPGEGVGQTCIDLRFLSLEGLSEDEINRVGGARDKRGEVCTSAGCEYQEGLEPEDDACVNLHDSCPQVASFNYNNAAANGGRGRVCRSLNCLFNDQNGNSAVGDTCTLEAQDGAPENDGKGEGAEASPGANNEEVDDNAGSEGSKGDGEDIPQGEEPKPEDFPEGESPAEECNSLADVNNLVTQLQTTLSNDGLLMMNGLIWNFFNNWCRSG